MHLPASFSIDGQSEQREKREFKVSFLSKCICNIALSMLAYMSMYIYM